MRSTKHKDKKRCCKMCKPHKRGWAPKDTIKYQVLEKDAKNEQLNVDPHRP